MRLIDADSAPVYVNEQGCKMMERMPTIDAVPVVRCEKCKHTFGRKKGFVLCKRGWMPNDGFCSYGERKDGDTDLLALSAMSITARLPYSALRIEKR